MTNDNFRSKVLVMAKRKPRETVERKPVEVPDAILDLPKRLAEAMERDDINATQLSERADVSKQVITRLLNGERRDGVRGASIIKLANALGVRVGWLLAGEKPENAGTFETPEAARIVAATLRHLGYPLPGSEVPENVVPATPKHSEQAPSGD